MSRIGNKHSPFPMDRGIEKILRAADDGVETGPVADISPAFSPVKPRLEQLYSMPNLEDYLASELAPAINDPSLLLPNRFNAALRNAVEALNVAAEEDPRNSRIFKRAATPLKDQEKLRELLRMFQQALLKG